MNQTDRLRNQNKRKKFEKKRNNKKITVSFTKDVLKDRFIKMAQDSGVFGVVHDLTKNTNLPPVSSFSLLHQFFRYFKYSKTDFYLIKMVKTILI